MNARRVMLVDDDGVCRAMLARGLERRGFEVCAYADPRDAMSRLEHDLPLAVITDMRMPHMTGLEVVREVRSRLGGDAPPILVVSVDDEEQLLEEAFRLGASDYLLKPVNEVELGVKLERALRPRSEARPAAMPERVGPWRLVECVGRGGTGCVFTALKEGEEELRALKLVWPHLTGNTETLLRFRREIDLLAQLDHPQVVKFLASGRHEDTYYYVMSYLPGGTLRRRIQRQGPGTPAQALDLIEGLCEPLRYLHAQEVVHRDLKPGNVFFDREDRLVLGDFGLARRLQDQGITLARDFIGTPLYLAPEVFRSAEFGPSVDLYSLGVCAYELLLGRPPLDRGAGDSVQLIAALMDDGLPPPSSLLPELPAPLLALLEDLLADAERRPSQAAAVGARAAEVRAALGLSPATPP